MTLVEVLVATTVFGMITAILLRAMLQLLTIFHYDTGKLLINRDLRTVTAELASQVSYASEMRIYSNPTEFKRVVADGEGGTAGNCLVLIYRDPADASKIARVITYYHRGAGKSLRRLQKTYMPASELSVDEAIPAIDAADAGALAVVPNVWGRQSGDALFNWMSERSVSVHAQLSRRGGITGTRNAKAEVTCWFVVSPRG